MEPQVAIRLTIPEACAIWSLLAQHHIQQDCQLKNIILEKAFNKFRDAIPDGAFDLP